MIVLTGKSGSGKSTIEKELIKNGYEKIVSYTTRNKRDNEIDGVDYHFITVENFMKLEKQGVFAEYTCYGDNYYSVAKKDCNEGKVLVVEKDGLIQLKKNKVEMVSFYIDVDVETRYQRMIKDKREKILCRIEKDGVVFEGIEKKVDYVIKNYDNQLQKCVEEILKRAREKDIERFI